MADSTTLVDEYSAAFAAEIYKTVLLCAAKIIRSEGGEITAYDGDRVMAVFLGSSKNTSAVRAALELNYARLKILQPALKAQYPNAAYEFRHVVGIDTSDVLVARTGIRGANDLVWVGSAANHAAKLSAVGSEFPTRISKEVYDAMHDSAKWTDGKTMWERVTWTPMSQQIYRSTWYWPFQ